ncbi:MAG TPA: tandem-95 repeat protein [Thermoanaerobaculia bacterium]|nr:tandem-95 repeat protein [Thermoanaerobaculia bacterium]
MSFRIARFVLGTILVTLLFVQPSAFAALTPATVVLTDTSGPQNFSGGPYATPNPSSQATGTPTCNAALTCDELALTVSVSPTTRNSKYVRVAVGWPVELAQIDLYVLQNGKLVTQSTSDTTYVEPDVVVFPAISGTYTIRVVPFLPMGQSITGVAELVDIPPVAPLETGVAPTFAAYTSPSTMGNNAGEPSMGVDWFAHNAALRHDKVNTGGIALFQSGANTLRINFDDATTPPTATWENVSSPLVQQFALSDPIGFVDRQTGRGFALDLIGGEGNSFAAYTDDDGATWTPMQGGGIPAGPDHQTLGSGPYNPNSTPPPPPHPLYPNAVYYCSQNIVGGAECSRSDDGGLTFGPGVDIFDPSECYGGIHGHVKVGPDGTVYVPNSTCSAGNNSIIGGGIGSQGVAISRDNGLTWTDSVVPGSTGSGDPSIGIGADNTVYIGWIDGDGHPHVAVSTDHGAHWTNNFDVGAQVGVQNAVFSTMVAGDGDRAAYGFVGTTTGGFSQDASFPGVWHFYISTTYDRGAHWVTVDATPNDPVQVGAICLLGIACSGHRNLLDFNDITVDKEGRVLAAFADGCVGCTNSSPVADRSDHKASVIRQTSGRRLFAAYDVAAPTQPECSAPGVSVLTDPSGDATDLQPSHDLLGTSIAYPYTSDASPDTLVFTMKTGALTTLTPSSFYYTSFTIDGAPEGAGAVKGVRMAVGATGAVTFESYVAGASTTGAVDGRFIASSLPAEAGSKYDPNGTITIIVKLSSLGITPGHQLTRFNGAVVQTISTPAGGTASILDWMPGTAPARGTTSFTAQSNQACRPASLISFKLNASAYSVGESAGSLAVTVMRVGNAAPAVSVNYATSNGTATAGSDYTAVSGILNFASNETSKTISIPILGDNNIEANETFTLTLSSPVGGQLGSPVAATITISDDDAPPPPVADARYHVFAAPNGVGTSAGEPTIGVNWFTGRAMFQANLQTLRVTFDDCVSPARATWENKSPATSANTLDPFLVTDRPRGNENARRTIVSQLVGTDSLSSLSDDDGDLWIPNQGGGIVSGVDHQSIGAGPYHTPIPANATYPHAVYYCSQDLVNALCALSLDGGLTYGPPVPIYTSDSCGGIHGHVKVGADGTAYVPNKTCGASALAAVVVSKDNGLTWTVKTIPGSGTTGFLVDPSVGTASDGSVYVGWQHSDGHPHVAVSHDQGDTWQYNTDVGEQLGLQNSVFPAVVAGDKDRAAFAFLGTTSPGNYTNIGFQAEWHLYVAQTLDGGAHWKTVDATPNDPVQRGSICTLGTTICEEPPVGSRTIDDRNLLDFMGIAVDKQGRTYVGFADGCTTPECIQNGVQEYSRKATIARQSGGKGLFAAYDAPSATVPGAPNITALSGSNGVTLTWLAPDDGGSPIVSYRVYRRTSGGVRALIANIGGTSYTDPTGNAGYLYSVGAVNAAGESTFCSSSEVAPVAAPDPCHLPGVALMTDAAGDGPTGALDLLGAWVAEPDQHGGADKLVWTLKVADLSSIPANSQWYIIWDFGLGPRRYVAAKSDAASALTYEYGYVGPALSPTAPDPNANRAFREGAAEGVVDAAKGTFTITVLNSQVGSPHAGQTLGTISPRSFAGTGNVNITGSTAADITSVTPSYTLSGNASCGNYKIAIARDDFATTQENTAVAISVLSNDSDGGAPPLTITSVSQPAHGIATKNANGTITYDPSANFNGSDAFTYTITNGDGISATANVSITIPAFCPSVPTGSFTDTFEPTEKAGWTVDTPVNGAGISPTWQVITDPLAHSSSHSFYTDATGGVPQTSFGMKDDRLIAPPQDLSSTSHLRFWHRYEFETGYDGGVLEVSTDGGKTWKDVVAGGGSFVTGGYSGVIIAASESGLANRAAWTGGDSTAPMSLVDVDLGAFAGARRLVRWRAALDGNTGGVAWFVDDVEFTNTMVPTTCNHPPKTANDIASTVENHAVTINVLSNDSDPDGDSLTVASVTQPAHGSVTNNGASVTYTPAANTFGNDSFTYTASDGKGGSATASVSVTVSERPNQPPTASLSATPTSGDAPLTVTFNGAGSSDPDTAAGDSVTSYTFDFGDGSSAVTQSSPTISHAYASPGSFTATLVVRDVKNASSAPASVVITVTQPNRAPVAQDDAAVAAKNTAVTFNVLSNDSDPDGDAISVVATGTPLHGTLANNGGGNLTYTPGNGYTGTDSFSYTITDGHAHTASANVMITVVKGQPSKKAGGSGWIAGSNGSQSNFAFDAQSSGGTVSGRINYTATGVNMNGTVNQLNGVKPQADLSGPCSMPSGVCTYTLHVEDRASPGAGADLFRIRIYNAAGTLIHSAEGTLGGGDVQVK